MQHKINLNGKTLLFVGLPKATYIAFIDKNELIVRMGYEFHQEQNEINLPQGDWQLIGIYPELTEEMAKMVVEGGFCSTNGINLYQDYSKEDGTHSTALESFQSLMERENITGYDKYAILIKSK